MYGTLTPNFFSASRGLMPFSLKKLDISYNPQLVGQLPPAGATFTNLQEIVRTHTPEQSRTRADLDLDLCGCCA